jgi:peptidoglycan/LPS O-acetylase OafA/YrhL
LIQAIFVGVNSFPGGWSISFEWLFSVMNIALVKLKVKIVFYLLLLILLSQLVSYYFSTQDRNLVSHPLITLGTNFGFFVSGHLLKRLNYSYKNVKYLFLLSFCAPLINPSPPYNLFFYNISLILLFLFCLGYKTTIKWISDAIHFIGVRTYGIFLGHFIVMIALQNSQLFLNFQSNSGILGKLGFFSIVTISAIAIGSLTYRFIEKPIILQSNKKFRSDHQ